MSTVETAKPTFVRYRIPFLSVLLLLFFALPVSCSRLMRIDEGTSKESIEDAIIWLKQPGNYEKLLRWVDTRNPARSGRTTFLNEPNQLDPLLGKSLLVVEFWEELGPPVAVFKFTRDDYVIVSSPGHEAKAGPKIAYRDRRVSVNASPAIVDWLARKEQDQQRGNVQRWVTLERIFTVLMVLQFLIITLHNWLRIPGWMHGRQILTEIGGWSLARATLIDSLLPAVAVILALHSWNGRWTPPEIGIWTAYGILTVASAGMMWWEPYSLGATPERQQSFARMFAGTRFVLPARKGDRGPNLAHLIFHAIFVLNLLLTFALASRGY